MIPAIENRELNIALIYSALPELSFVSSTEL
jgi:hypothetical protein